VPDETAVGREARAGSQVLSVFAHPLNTKILRAHKDGARRLAELEARTGFPARTTLRAAVVALRGIGALDKRRVGRTPYGIATELTPMGREMLTVAADVEAWLGRAPGGALELEVDEAKEAVRALTSGWSSSMVWALASRPFTLTELDRQIPELSYASLERRLASMKSAGQVEPAAVGSRGTAYLATDWLRRAIAPLCSAARCERRHLRDSAPITNVEVEAAFMLTVPLASLPRGAIGACALVVQADPAGDEQHSQPAGVLAEVRQGQIVSCEVGVDDRPPTWCAGPPEVWLDAVIDGRFGDLRIGGADPQLAANLINGMHFALFPDR
jgi:DNA-binding HxlR family transcriptional regulator